VRHVYEAYAEPPLQILQLDLHLFAKLKIKRGERLVQQQHARLENKRAGKRHTLLLPARQLVYAPVVETREADKIERIRYAPLYLARRRAPPLKPE
jgi:hypothetical protein